jgi:hypothetical protein
LDNNRVRLLDPDKLRQVIQGVFPSI